MSAALLINDDDLEARVVRAHLASLPPKAIIIPAGALDQGLVKVALKIDDLLHRTNQFSRKNAPRCVGSLYRVERARNRWMFRVKCGEPTSDGNGHIVRVRPMPGKSSQLKDRDILCVCSCPGFIMWGGTFNAQTKDYWEGTGPKVQAPTVQKNLKRNYMICKHIYTALKEAKNYTVRK